MLHREYYVDNAGHADKWFEVKCDKCGMIMCCSWPRVSDNGMDYCGECAFKLGIIDPFEYCKNFLFSFGHLAYYAEVINDKIHIFTERQYKAKFLRSKKGETDKRNSPEYKIFRSLVYDRDDYTCQHCGKKGCELNAHHTKSYKNHKKLRLDISNGITLCVPCHKKEHKRIKSGKV